MWRYRYFYNHNFVWNVLRDATRYLTGRVKAFTVDIAELLVVSLIHSKNKARDGKYFLINSSIKYFFFISKYRFIFHL